MIVFKMVDHKVQPRFWNHVHKGRQHLESVLAPSKNDQVVAKQVVVLKNVPLRTVVL